MAASGYRARHGGRAREARIGGMRTGGRRVFSNDIAIDLGTANTLVHLVGRGIVIDEPSVVAVSSRRGMREMLAIGRQALAVAARSPEPIELVRPLRDGVIADFVATEEMLRQFIRRARTTSGFRRPRILICLPAGATPVERRAVHETAASAGAREVLMLEEPVAAAVGLGLGMDDEEPALVVDMGGGTTDIAVLAGGEIIESRSIRIAGNAMDEAISRHVRRMHQVIIDDESAERIKIEAGSAGAVNGSRAEVRIRGRDIRYGHDKEVVLGPGEVGLALGAPIGELAEFIVRTLEDLEPQISGAIAERGIHLTGGGALLDRLDAELQRQVGVPFHVPPAPMHCVIRGTAAVLQDLDDHRHLLIRP